MQIFVFPIQAIHGILIVKGVARMPKSDNQKLKILYIWDYLQKNSHQDHLVSTQELLQMLRSHDISCERKTVFSDIAALRDYGVDIESVPGCNGGYYIASRNFELPELKMLIDAVQSSRFLTEKKSRELIEKLCTQCSVYDARLMRRDVVVSGRVKSMNETIYYNVDAIQDAIADNRQITFRYFDYHLDGTRRYRNRDYQASPYGLCQENENCYLLAFSARHGITSYRVDRMSDIQLLPDSRVLCPELEGKQLVEHANRLFQMYSGSKETVKLRFHRDLVNVVMDRFGKNTMLIPDGEEYFVFTVNVAVSPMFLSWVIGFGRKAKILFPQSVVDQCTALCWETLEVYGGSSTPGKL